MFNWISKFLENAFKTRAKGTAAFSFVMSTLITFIIYLIAAVVSGTINGGKISLIWLNIGTWGAVAVVSLYMFLFVAIWTVLYILEQNDAEDIYTWVRKLLLGTWQVRYSIRNGAHEKDPPLVPDPVITCEIYINDLNRKLEMQFNITGNPVWADKDQYINMISLRNEAEDNYSLVYYFHGVRHLSDRFSSHIIPETAADNPAHVDVEILGSLKFQARSGVLVREMEGGWFDLNGNVTRVFSVISELQKTQPNAAPLRMKLSEAPINTMNFSAFMGPIFFTRVGRAQTH